MLAVSQQEIYRPTVVRSYEQVRAERRAREVFGNPNADPKELEHALDVVESALGKGCRVTLGDISPSFNRRTEIYTFSVDRSRRLEYLIESAKLNFVDPQVFKIFARTGGSTLLARMEGVCRPVGLDLQSKGWVKAHLDALACFARDFPYVQETLEVRGREQGKWYPFLSGTPTFRKLRIGAVGASPHPPACQFWVRRAKE